ncbi:MAG: hypothetical protein HY650_00880, partial [Acidobacteria bacterium]|nr:hypothetical protein [Acidobacteriota bacterium]
VVIVVLFSVVIIIVTLLVIFILVFTFLVLALVSIVLPLIIVGCPVGLARLSRRFRITRGAIQPASRWAAGPQVEVGHGGDRTDGIRA